MDSEEEKTSQDILESTIDLIDSYKGIFEVNSLALYFKSMICLLLGRAEECREWLDQGLKVAEDCSWKWLWIKGVVEVQLGNYYEAVKEFSAGLILESRP